VSSLRAPVLDLAFRGAILPAARSDAADLTTTVAALFDEHAPALLRYIRSVGIEPAAAEDVLQDTFVALHRHLALDRPRSNLAGWLFQVAHNLARRELRRRRRGVRPLPWTDAPMGRLVDPEPTPETRLVEGETGRRVRAAVNNLPARDQQCLRLRAEGLRYRDIAAVLEMSLGSVAKSVARSLAYLATAARG
jgi:RNA polymerase sigma-70 factor (ECF subfamily)